MKLSLILFFSLLIINNSLLGANEPRVLTEWVPFVKPNNHILVDVNIKGQKVKAIIDTGANISAISKSVANQLSVKPGKGHVWVGGMVGDKKMRISRNTAVELPGLFSRDVNFVMFDNIENIGLILGMDFMFFDVLQFDYVNNRLRFATSNVFSFNPESAIPMEISANRYFVQASIENIELKMLLDTGNPGKIYIPHGDIEGTSLFNELNNMEKITNDKGGLHEREFSYYKAKTNNFSLGPYVLENVTYGIASEETPLSNDYSILGYDILKNFIVTMDIKNSNLYLSLP